MPSFHVYPSKQQTFAPYDRSQPLACDTLEWDTTGCFDLVNHCFVAQCDCVMLFHANILWQAPIANAALTVLFIKNTLPPPGGAYGGEIAGDDAIAIQPTGSNNQSTRVTRMLKLNQGDRVWTVPCINSGGKICNAVAGNGNNTVCYFEGVLID